MRALPGLHLDYVSLAEYQAARWGDVLGVATFNGAPDSAAGAAEIPVAQVSTAVLPGSGHVYEVWRCDTPATSGRRHQVRFRGTADMLFGCIALTEAPVATATAGRGSQHSPLHQATTQAYREICATLDAENYPYLLRVWNYLPDINRDSHGTERYRQFNTARQQVLRECGRALAGKRKSANNWMNRSISTSNGRASIASSARFV